MNHIKFSIIISTYNNEQTLLRCLTRLCRMSYPVRYFEILIIYTPGDNDTKKIVDSFIQRHPRVQIRLYAVTQRSLSRARNTGVACASFEHLLFLDDDVLVPKNILASLHQAICEYPNASVIGGKVNILPNATLTKLSPYFTGAEYVLTKSMFPQTSPTFFTYPGFVYSACMYVHKPDFSEPMFNQKLARRVNNIFIGGEDIEFCLRALLHGKRILYDPRISVVHNFNMNRLSARYFLYRFFITGVDTRCIDDQLSHEFPEHIRFSINKKYLFINLPLNVLTKKNKSYHLARYAQYVLLLYGYYIYPIFMNNRAI